MRAVIPAAPPSCCFLPKTVLLHTMALERREPAHPDSLAPDASGAARSAAWQRAEGVFAMPPPAPQVPTAVVTVRKSRVAGRGIATVAADAAEAPQAVDLSAAQDKGPRVFRLEPAPSLAPAAVPPDTVQAPPPRQRRIASDKRPGPVLRVFSAPDAADADDGAMDAVAPKHRIEALGQMLGGVDQVLADIRRARSFRFLR
jgi:hypothetical protein